MPQNSRRAWRSNSKAIFDQSSAWLRMPTATVSRCCLQPASRSSPFCERILAVWANSDFSFHSAAALRILVAGATLGLGAQFSCGAALFGLGRHGTYSAGVVLEALAGSLMMWAAVPKAGILGAAFALALMTVLIRGVFASSLFCRYSATPWLNFIGSVYLGPLEVGVPVIFLGCACRALVMGGHQGRGMIPLVAVLEAMYVLLAIRFCVEAEHRAVLKERVRRMLTMLWRTDHAPGLGSRADCFSKTNYRAATAKEPS